MKLLAIINGWTEPICCMKYYFCPLFSIRKIEDGVEYFYHTVNCFGFVLFVRVE